MEVQITSRKLMKPSSPTPIQLRHYKLTFLDQLNFPIYAEFLLYYPITGKTNNPIEENLRRRQILEKSLSETLTIYYPLAGRYSTDGELVICNDEGVCYLEAQVDGDLAEILSRTLATPSEKFIPSEIGDPKPLLAVQINSFNCGGIVVALQYDHHVADGISMAAFLNAWASVAREGIDAGVIRPNLELAAHIPPKPSFRSPQCNPMRNDVVTKIFQFKAKTISAMKAKARQTSSRVQVVMAIIWKAIIQLIHTNERQKKKTWVLEFSMNLRGKTVPPLSNNTFGNFYTLAHAIFTGDANTLSWQDLAVAIGDETKTKLLDFSKRPLHSDEFCSMIADSYLLIERFWEDEEVDYRLFSSWCRFPFYEVDFGWGKPCWVPSISVPYEVVVLMDSKDGDGIDAWVSLNQKDMVEFEKNHDIIYFTS